MEPDLSAQIPSYSLLPCAGEGPGVRAVRCYGTRNWDMMRQET